MSKEDEIESELFKLSTQMRDAVHVIRANSEVPFDVAGLERMFLLRMVAELRVAVRELQAPLGDEELFTNGGSGMGLRFWAQLLPPDVEADRVEQLYYARPPSETDIHCHELAEEEVCTSFCRTRAEGHCFAGYLDAC